MFIKKVSPTLFRALGIFLPLITTNCAILGLALFQTNKGYSFVQCIDLRARRRGRLHTGALTLLAGVREKLELAEVPDAGERNRTCTADGRNLVHLVHGLRGAGRLTMLMNPI